jgi:cytochrome c-type biogenesis protein CcmE
LRRRLWQLVIVIFVVVVASLALQFFFRLSDYVPKFYEPKDLEREKHQEKQK